MQGSSDDEVAVAADYAILLREWIRGSDDLVEGFTEHKAAHTAAHLTSIVERKVDQYLA